jgi:hypothetical protein
MYKKTLQIFVGLALTMQLAGCFYIGSDRRWHGGHHHMHQDSGIDIHVHG